MNASDKQIAFLGTLMAERVHTIEDLDLATLTKGAASALIDALMKAPRQKAQEAAEEGFYLMDEAVYRVVRSKSTGNPYAKMMTITGTKGAWEYAPGMVGKLAKAQRLTVEIAAKMGAHYGICMICGATLTDPQSVEQGIGPVCITKI